VQEEKAKTISVHTVATLLRQEFPMLHSLTVCVCIYVFVCLCVCVCVPVCVLERERESVCVAACV